ncbi:MAG: dockerin type I repeat-containing protein [candidate division Zixibacteria bacterium]|nr:dockerin type I repeat-containing protein [candidate division Zixibacteria bacterium]
MSLRLVVISLLVFIFVAGPLCAETKKQARLVRIDDLDKTELRVAPSLITADTCIVRHDQGIFYKIDGWVTGNELYKSYLDPEASCPSPYPFTIIAINMPMFFGRATTLSVSVDVEAVDLSVPGCPYPGELLSVSSEWVLDVPGRDLYDIWIPLDTPVTVNGPFFAGFFLGSVFEVADSAAVVIDTFPTTCVSYNIWDDTLGWVDLVDNSFYNFSGRLVLYAAGIPSDGGPTPQLSFMFPQEGDTLLGSASLWAHETTRSTIVSHTEFEYRSGTTWIMIGQDVDGTSSFRDGTNQAGIGDDFSIQWNFEGLSEGNTLLRATVYDTLGQGFSETVSVYLKPKPPLPTIVSPSNGESFCTALNLLASCPDPDALYMYGLRHPADNTYSASLAIVGPSPHGSHYNGPLAAATIIQLWFDRGYEDLMNEGGHILTLDSLANQLANNYTQTAADMGTWDGHLVSGMRDFFEDKGVPVNSDFQRSPDYYTIRQWAEGEQRGVLLGLGGTPGQWVTVDGFSGWEQPDGTHLVRISNPVTGTMDEVPIRQIGAWSSLYLDGSWHQIDIMISVIPTDWTVNLTSFAGDLDGSDGWSITWTPTGIIEGDWYHVTAIAGNSTGHRASSSVLLHYDCGSSYAYGDYDGDGVANILDLDYLMDFVASNGEPPIGGGARADANGDGTINITDVVYYMNFLFGTASPPNY